MSDDPDTHLHLNEREMITGALVGPFLSSSELSDANPVQSTLYVVTPFRTNKLFGMYCRGWLMWTTARSMRG